MKIKVNELQVTQTALQPLINKCEKSLPKLKVSSAQHTLLIRRIEALRISVELIKKELSDKNNNSTKYEKMKPRISVLTLGVADIGKSVEFYRDGLGLHTEGIIGKEFEPDTVAFFKIKILLKN